MTYTIYIYVFKNFIRTIYQPRLYKRFKNNTILIIIDNFCVNKQKKFMTKIRSVLKKYFTLVLYMYTSK